jgi:hypothetical protein
MIRKRLFFFILAAAALLGDFPARAIDGPRPQSRLTRTQWAPQFAGGPIRVLFVGPYGAQQDAFELMERFDIQGKVVALSDHNDVKKFGIESVYWPDLAKRPEQVLDELREALKTDWQVLVMDVFPQWPNYPDDVREMIVAAVAGGRSLLAANWEGPLESLAEHDVAIEALDGKASGFASLHRCGKGLLGVQDARIDHRFGYLFAQATRRSDYERSTAEVGRLLLHLARPEAPQSLAGIAFDAGRITVRTRESAPDSLRTLRVAVSRCDDDRLIFDDQARGKPDNRKYWTLPSLAAGEYQVRAVAKDRQGAALDWDV